MVKMKVLEEPVMEMKPTIELVQLDMYDVAEEKRIAAEMDRQSGEAARIAAEEQRVMAEQIRMDTTAGIVVQTSLQAQVAVDAAKSAEAAKTEAEAARVAIENLAVETTTLEMGNLPW